MTTPTEPKPEGVNKKYYKAKDDNEFAVMVINHAHRRPQQAIGELIKTELTDGVLYVYLDLEVYNGGKYFAVSSEEVIPMLKKGYTPIMDTGKK